MKKQHQFDSTLKTKVVILTDANKNKFVEGVFLIVEEGSNNSREYLGQFTKEKEVS